MAAGLATKVTTPPSTGSTGLLAVTRHRERVGEGRADGRRLRGAAGDGRHREALALEGADVDAADARLAALVGRGGTGRGAGVDRRAAGQEGDRLRSGRHSCPGSPAPGRPRRRGCRRPHPPARPSRRCRSGCSCPTTGPTISLGPNRSYCRRRSCRSAWPCRRSSRCRRRRDMRAELPEIVEPVTVSRPLLKMPPP